MDGKQRDILFWALYHEEITTVTQSQIHTKYLINSKLINEEMN